VDKFLIFTITGISLAAVYAIAACGLVVTYTTSGIFNFAHGAVGMIAAFTYWQFHDAWGWHELFALPMVVLVVAPALGAVIERVVMRNLGNASEAVRIVVPVSLLLFLFGLASVIWPGNIARNSKDFFPGKIIRIGGVNVSYHRITILVVAIIVAAALWFILRKTRTGVAMRAVVDDRSLVQLNGGRPDRVSMISWAIGASLGAISGILVAPTYGLKQLDLTFLVVNAFAAAVVGRLRSLPWAFAGAMMLGLGESYVKGYLVSNKEIGGFALGNLSYAVPPLLLFVMLVVQPEQRLRTGGVQRARDHWPIPSMRVTWVGAVSLVVVTASVASLMGTDTSVGTLIPAYFFALMALSLVPLAGYAGQVSLASLTFAGIGALMMSVVGTDHSLWGLIAAVVVSALVGALIALPALRLSGIYLALATAAFAILMTKIVFTQPVVMPGGNRQVPPIEFGPISTKSNFDQLLVMSVCFALLGVAMIAIRRSAFGRRLTAMKDSPVACATLGLNLMTTKIAVFALSSGIAGFAGAIWYRQIQFSDFELVQSMSVTMLAVVGGVGAVAGAFFGGFLFGVTSNIVPTVFKSNAIGLFGFAEISVSDLMQVAPGFAGIGLSQNPSGAIGQIADAYRDVSKSRVAIAVAIAGPAALWVAAKTQLITNWSFTAAIAVFVFGVIGLVPALLDVPGRGAAGLGWCAAAVVTVAAVSWESLIESNGVRVVAIGAVAALVARVALNIGGIALPGSALPEPSPDFLGVGAPLTQSDVVDAEQALGVRELLVKSGA